MTPEEICRDWRLAKHPRRHIRVLAELNAVSVDEIKNILGLTEEIEMARIAWTPELDAKLIGSWASGMSWKDIAQEFNSTEYAVKARHKKIKQLAKTVKPAPIEPIHTPEPEPELEPEPIHTPAPIMIVEAVCENENTRLAEITTEALKLAEIADMAISEMDVVIGAYVRISGAKLNGNRITVELSW